jgi:hypothetical protein
MSRQQFIDWNPNQRSIGLVGIANAICADYARQGFDLTLRQLYYQFVARGHIPNTMKSYKSLGGIIDQARLGGLLDWNYIVDRTRNVYRTDGADDDPAQAIADAARDYALTLWEDQPNHVEVWVEKEALAGVVQQAASQVGVNYFACRGYVSQSEMHSAGNRFRRYGQRDKTNYIVHLGDHDPSGIDMTRDIEDRLLMFAGPHCPIIKRVALNMDQIEQYRPPPNPAKSTDSRYGGYLAEYGDESWELDALDPATLSALITSTVLELRDETLWNAAYARQETDREQLQTISDRWHEISEYLS